MKKLYIKYFAIPTSLTPVLDHLADADIGRGLKLALKYALEDCNYAAVEPEYDKETRDAGMVFDLLRPKVDEARDRLTQAQINGSKGGRPANAEGA